MKICRARSEIVFLFVVHGCRGCLSARNQCKKCFLLSLHFVKHERHFSRFSPSDRCRHFALLFGCGRIKRHRKDFPNKQDYHNFHGNERSQEDTNVMAHNFNFGQTNFSQLKSHQVRGKLSQSFDRCSIIKIAIKLCA